MQPHAHQDVSQCKDKSTSNWKVWGIGCLLATSIMVSPVGMIFWQLYDGYHKAKRARGEFQRSVKPDELRAWVWAQLQKHPQDSSLEEPLKEWPDTFPKFPAHSFSVDLYPPKNQPEKRVGALLVWSFRGHYLMVDVRLNPDGTPADANDTHQQWAKGIVLKCFARH